MMTKDEKPEETPTVLDTLGTCPNCGYCPSCGRASTPVVPYIPYVWPPQPYVPWWGTLTVHTQYAQTSSAAVGSIQAYN